MINVGRCWCRVHGSEERRYPFKYLQLKYGWAMQILNAYLFDSVMQKNKWKGLQSFKLKLFKFNLIFKHEKTELV